MPMIHKDSRRVKPIHILLMAAVPAIAVIGFIVMYTMDHVIPLTGGDLNAALFMLMMVIFGLSVPYAMLKLGVHETAHVRGEPERELELKDIPKDKEQLWNKDKWNREQKDVVEN